MKALALLPLVFLLLLGALLYGALGRDPHKLESARVGKPAPTLPLPVLDSNEQRSLADFAGQPILLNVFASWCAVCVVEHPTLSALSEEPGVVLVGLNYQDEPAAARSWLRRHGNPYQTILVDRDGRAAIELGVYGAPETFLIDAAGVIRHRHVGAMTAAVYARDFAPLMAAGP